MKYLMTVLLVLSFIKSEAQDQDSKMTTGFFGVEMKDNKKDIVGSPYIDANFSQYTITGHKTNDVPSLRYNNYSDQMEYMKDKASYDLDRVNNMIVSLRNGNKTYVYLDEYFVGNDSKSGYLQVLLSGSKSTLYKKEAVIIQEKLVKEDVMDVGKKIQEYSTSKPQYFLKLNDKVVAVPQKKGDFNDLFTDNESKDFIKKNKISSTKEQDLIKLVNFLNK
ncbi:hypothetical protein SAMN05443634_107175 [Chishuiella changwenlii]|uniref:Uncharacterized protein n=1 Tax=Chishuiella changwenlii TaxID=1434701 RepID=A0A1M6Z5N7_9FLAO|nr:hypothetical protein [Chishuiella changwenlii]GGE87124.1 hypothetical protein GCM10010984_01130 [Chishuiella changwenlii]SHL25712.1 hypothetical protein SAMN05443634_107175 [Chishuiella changwenlii]